MQESVLHDFEIWTGEFDKTEDTNGVCLVTLTSAP